METCVLAKTAKIKGNMKEDIDVDKKVGKVDKKDLTNTMIWDRTNKLENTNKKVVIKKQYISKMHNTAEWNTNGLLKHFREWTVFLEKLENWGLSSVSTKEASDLSYNPH